MSLAIVGVFVAKAFFVVMFGMNVAVILTWVDRRQGAVIADRVGPNRAVLWLPKRLAQGMVVLPALGIAGGGLGWAWSVREAPPQGSAFLFAQLGILATWLIGLVLAGRVARHGVQNSVDAFLRWLGDPRLFFYVGMGAHLLVLAVAVTAGLPQPLFGSGVAVLAFAVLCGAGYAAHAIESEDRVGLRLAGLLHPAADGLKTMFKEDFVPPNSDKLLHGLAPFISFFPSLVVLAVVPFGDTLCFGTKDGKIDLLSLARTVPREGVCTDGAIPLQVVDLNVGILFFFALAGTGIVGAALAGWASDNKFSLLGGLRAASQMVSYEVTLGLTLIGALMIYGTLRVDEMVRWQAENSWGIFVQPLAFFLFFAASVAESKRIPFDLPEGESELVAGYFTEYSGMKFAMFFFAEYVAVVSSSALIAALFLGGWHLPFIERDGIHIAIGDSVLYQQTLTHLSVVLLGFFAFIGKTIALCWLQITIRWTLPRFRYDQLMRLGWRKLLPASLVNILVTGLVVLALQGLSASAMGGLRVLGDLTEAAVALLGLLGTIWFIRFLLAPVHKRRMVVSSAQRMAAQLGGTRTAKMGA